MTDEPQALRKALIRALNRMNTPLGTSSHRIEWTEEQVNRMDFEQLKREEQRALSIVYSPRANLPPEEVPHAVSEAIEGAKEVVSIISRILEAEP
jgi:ABC-type proline/glycine betaine transport system ATPase subunit